MKKKCATCGETKEANRTKSSEFSWNKGRYRYSCKPCVSKYNRKSWERTQRKKRKREDEAKEKEIVEGDPEKYFIGRICWRAGLDKDMKFLNSEWFDELCDLASFEPDSMRKLCRKVSIRN